MTYRIVTATAFRLRFFTARVEESRYMFSPRAFTADDRSTAEYTAALPFFTRGGAGGDTMFKHYVSIAL
jgi:hypothetical protein